MCKSVFFSNRDEYGIIYLSFRTILNAQEFLRELKRRIPKVIVKKYFNYCEKPRYLKSPNLNLPKRLHTGWFKIYNIEYQCDFTLEDKSDDDIFDIVRDIAFNLGYYLLFVRFVKCGNKWQWGIDCINPISGSIKRYE